MKKKQEARNEESSKDKDEKRKNDGQTDKEVEFFKLTSKEDSLERWKASQRKTTLVDKVRSM